MAQKPSSEIGLRVQKLQPKLRVVTNGDSVVNSVRAEQSACIGIATNALYENVAPQRSAAALELASNTASKPKTKVKKLAAVPKDVTANVFIHTRDMGKVASEFPGESARRANIVAANVSLANLDSIAQRPDVLFVEAGEALAVPRPVVTARSTDAPKASLRKVGNTNLHHYGKGVLVGIIDVQGFDFSHPDFLHKDGNTRFVRIWDQGGDARPHPAGKAYDYGSEFTKEHLDAAIKAAPGLGVPAYEIERQSQIAVSSHGTHVASIAAGGTGIAPDALLAGVLISLPEDDLDRRKSFYDSTRIAHAVDYLFSLGDELGVPVSINISLGTNGHAHDASSAISRWIDSALALPGRAVCVATGNAGQEKPEFPGDSGFIIGRIHTSGQIPSRGLYRDIEWMVVGNGLLDVSENELELWYGAQDRFAVSVKPPGGEWIGPINPRQFIQNRQLNDGTFISIYNELYHPANGANYISIYLSPFFSNTGVIGVGAGKWIVRLHGDEVRNGNFHGWIERDDPRKLGRVGPREAWNFPSFFSEQSNVDNSSASSLACGQRTISVANLDADEERINISSSQGPTRDNRSKPDVAAPGTNIVAAKGFAGADDLWVAMTGTSMASPYVAGVAALMLATQGKLTAAQIEGIIQRTARPLPGATFAWLNDAGFGAINPKACVEEASLIDQREDLT
jgi:subtilisin family serine protease